MAEDKVLLQLRNTDSGDPEMLLQSCNAVAEIRWRSADAAGTSGNVRTDSCSHVTTGKRLSLGTESNAMLFPACPAVVKIVITEIHFL
jgi:hypothetical protein